MLLRKSARPIIGRHRLCTDAIASAAAARAAKLKSSLFLPKTSFPQHHNPLATDQLLAPVLAREHYAAQASCRASAQEFILHDGPPYANGDLHLGHFLNKSLKDMINRWMLLRGRRIEYRPGWDCHGLPIELRALQEAAAAAASSGAGPGEASTLAQVLTPLQIRQRAAACAQQVVDAQRRSFERWGVMGDWDAPYATMQPSYEAAQLGVLKAMLGRGLIFRGSRPVHWSPASRTALAEAELDYMDAHRSSAAYVAFPLMMPAAGAGAGAGEGLGAEQSLEGASVVIWTTTPWTLPANQAVCAREDLAYAVVEVGEARVADPADLERRVLAQAEAVRETKAAKKAGAADKAAVDASVAALLALKAQLQEAERMAAAAPTEGRGQEGVEEPPTPTTLLVAEARVNALSEALRRPLTVKVTVRGSDLAGMQCAHPLSGRPVPLLFGEHVKDDAGTGLVHTAPGHGPEDFVVGQKYGLPVACPVDESGCFTRETDEAAPFAGLAVLDEGNAAVLDALVARRALLACDRAYEHRYPYDWRSKTPVIFRTTPQWFAQLGRLREPALASLEGVAMTPPSGRTRLEGFLKGRTEWCLSRQRAWGVPLPAFYHVETGEALLTEETVEHVRQLVALHGSDCWWKLGESELLPPSMQADAAKWRKGIDTLDVWFDSGSSWSAVLEPRTAQVSAQHTSMDPARGSQAGDADPPLADLYLEGSDQHRGWFQSSLLTYCGANELGGAPYGAIVTHGFVVDERGAKMSKSVGNVITPAQLLDGANGATATTAKSGMGDGKKEAADGVRAKNMSQKERKQARQARQAQSPYGVDVLRLWVAMSDWKADVAVGDTVLSKASESYRRLRNSCRFILGNLHDFDASADALPLDALRTGDRYMLHQLAEFAHAAERYHDQHALNRVTTSALVLATESLSGRYFDATKDHLYCGDKDGASRRAVQTVLHHTLDTLLLAMQPIVPFLAEEVHAHRNEPRPLPPVERLWSAQPAEWTDHSLARRCDLAYAVGTEVSKAIHLARQGSKLKGAADAMVDITCVEGSELHTTLRDLGSELNDMFGVSATRLTVCSEEAIAEALAASEKDDSIEGSGAIGGFGGRVTVPPVGGPTSNEESTHVLRLQLHSTSNPRCDRCWRHVPATAASGDVQGNDGWLYRGHPGDACLEWQGPH